MKTTILSMCVMLLSLTANAQTAKKKPAAKPAKTVVVKKVEPKATAPTVEIEFGEGKEKVMGELFSTYKSGEGNFVNIADRYHCTTAAKQLVITEVNYEMEGDKKVAKSITKTTMPKAKLDKKNSYVLNMEDNDATSKTWRLTLLSSTANSNDFTEETKYVGDEQYAKKKVAFGTYYFETKEEGEKWKTTFLN